MDNILMISLLIVGFISFIPVSKMISVKNSGKYRCLKYLILITFTWTIIIFMERLLTNTTVLYYSHLLSYPIKFALSAAMFCTVFNYIEKKINKTLITTFVVLLVLELGMALSNEFTNLLVVININDVNTITDIYSATKGSMFIYHLILTYVVLLSSIVYLFVFLAKNKDVVQYKEVTRTMAISSVFVLVINMAQLLFLDTTIDLTYISLVIVVYALYRTIYTKDMVFNLKTSGRGEILSNMREMYIITDQDKRVVEISSLLLEKYNLENNYIGKAIDCIFKDLEDSVIFYSSIDVKNTEASHKDHLHLREKKFELNGMNQYGYMILLYDETQVFNLLRELNKLSNFDTMTGLNNRNYIEVLLDSIEEVNNIGVISLDLNGLKINNDYLGHERGDYLLKKIAQIMKSETIHVKNKEMARIGGDEFLIVLYDTDEEVLKNIQSKIIEKGLNKDVSLEVSVSVGCSLGIANQKNIYNLIQEADEQMYQMKFKSSKQYKDRMIEYLEKIGKFIR